MTPEDSRLIIDHAGGPTALAKKLGFFKPDGTPHRQRVWKWTRDGIPPAVELEHLDLFKRLRRQALGN
jgi:hypothetical protein